jgi:hypothetical protein
MAYGWGEGAILDRTEINAPTSRRDTSLIVLPRAVPARIGMALRRRQSEFPELDCVRNRLSSELLTAVTRRAAEIGVGAERVMIAAGFIDEDTYAYALSRSLGFEYETFDGRDRASCPLDDAQLLAAAKTGLLPLVIDNELAFVVAPRSVRKFIDYVAFHPGARFRLTSAARLNLFVADQGAAAVAYKAAIALHDDRPHFCAGTSHRPFRFVLAALLASLLAMVVVVPDAMLVTGEAMLAVGFLAALSLRLFGSCLGGLLPHTTRIPDRELPTYTIVAALYRETKAVQGLVTSLRNLDYPGIMAQTPQAGR